MPKRPVKTWPRRGEIFLVSFDPTVGAEIKKTRPALVIQNDIANLHSPITIVAAITSRSDDRVYHTRVPINAGEGGLHADSLALLNQIRAIDTRRLARRLGKITPATQKRVDRAIQISLGLADL